MKYQIGIKLILLFIVLSSCSEKRSYWIYFSGSSNLKYDSDISDNRAPQLRNDSLLLPKYQKKLDQYSIPTIYYSHWLNAAVAKLTSSDIEVLLKCEIVEEITPVGSINFSRSNHYKSDKELSFSLEQIQAEYFINHGLTGKNVKIGIIDGGFLDADNKNSLVHVFENDAVKGYNDFLTPDLKRYGGSKAADDSHGTDVWEQISGIHTDRKVQFGLATNSEFYLARTDDGRKEYRQEEIYFVKALEWMEQQGVKLVNVSVGFSIGYDNPEENYLAKNINGSFTAATRAANIAAEKGMLLVVAAGNDGSNGFKVLSAPADSKGVLTVGATNYKTWNKANYSSIGPGELEYLKPNVSCFSFDGTSFSTPVITGMAACMMELDSGLSNLDVKVIIERSANLYPFGNNFIGHGVPSCKRALEILNSRGHMASSIPKNEQVEVVSKRSYTVSMPNEEGVLVIYHKSDSVNVISETKADFENYGFKVQRPKGAFFTTLMAGKFVKEIVWK